MLLAHGTSSKNLDDILKNGLVPRGEKVSCWEECPSHPDRVYLSNAYAFYFAHNFIKDDEDALIVEVDVDQKNLYPDEDFLGQVTDNATFNLPSDATLIDRTMWIRDRLEDMPRAKRIYYADMSLENIGNASHEGPIPVSRIRRMARIPGKDCVRLVLMEFDPIIATINYRLLGENYRKFQESLFDRYPFNWKEYRNERLATA